VERLCCVGSRERLRRVKVGWFIGGGVLYFVLIVTLGIMSIRKGHMVMFIVGIFLPIFWLIGALMPRRVR
jgi:hypothetical protein